MTDNPTTIDIAKIQLQDLLDDRTASLEDIANCEYALLKGVTRYGGIEHEGFSVQDRIDANKKIIKVIEFELKRRNIKIVESRA